MTSFEITQERYDELLRKEAVLDAIKSVYKSSTDKQYLLYDAVTFLLTALGLDNKTTNENE